MNAEWFILRLGNWKVTVTSLPDSAAACRDYQTIQLLDYQTN